MILVAIAFVIGLFSEPNDIYDCILNMKRACKKKLNSTNKD